MRSPASVVHDWHLSDLYMVLGFVQEGCPESNAGIFTVDEMEDPVGGKVPDKKNA